MIQRLPIIERSDVKNHLDQFWCRDVPRSMSETRRPADRRANRCGPATTPRFRSLRAELAHVLVVGVSPWDNTARVGRWGLQGASLRRNSLRWWPTDGCSSTPATWMRRRCIASPTGDGCPPATDRGLPGSGENVRRVPARHRTKHSRTCGDRHDSGPAHRPGETSHQELFAVPVFDQYRCSEIPWMAGECRERSGLHVFSDMRRIEVVNSEGRLLPRRNRGHHR